MRVILYLLLTFFSSHDSRIVFDTPSQVVSASLGETVMANPAKDTTYRFSAYVETQPSTGCEYDSTVDLVLEWTRTAAGPRTPHGLPGWQRYRVVIRKDGGAEGQLLLGGLFVARAGTRVSYHVEYSAGKGCQARPAYEIFPVLESMGSAG